MYVCINSNLQHNSITFCNYEVYVHTNTETCACVWESVCIGDREREGRLEEGKRPVWREEEKEGRLWGWAWSEYMIQLKEITFRRLITSSKDELIYLSSIKSYLDFVSASFWTRASHWRASRELARLLWTADVKYFTYLKPGTSVLNKWSFQKDVSCLLGFELPSPFQSLPVFIISCNLDRGARLQVISASWSARQLMEWIWDS